MIEVYDGGQMHSHGYQVSKSYLKIKKFNLLALFTMGSVSQWKVGNKNSALGNGCEGSGNRLVCLGHFSYRKCMENSKKCVFLKVLEFSPSDFIFQCY